ncbi:MAG: ABC transporter substrate-binding protein [Calditrichia bacterium]
MDHWYSGKFIYVAAGIALGLFLLYAAIIIFDPVESSPVGPTQIYFADNISPAHKKIIEQFNQLYSGRIEVVPIDLPFSKFSTNERKEILARSLRSKSDLIDVFAVDLIWVPRFAKWAEKLDPFWSKAERQKILPEAMISCFYNQELVASPFYLDIGVMYFRRDIIETLPDAEHWIRRLKESITWEELLQLRRMLPQYQDRFYLFQAKNYEGLVCNLVELINPRIYPLFRGDSLNLNTPGARRAVQFLFDLIHRYKVTPPVVLNYDEFQSYLFSLENDAVFLRGWPGFKRHYRHLIPDTTKIDRFDVAAVPHFQGEPPVAVFGGWNLMISKYSKNKWAANKFLQFILEEKHQKLLYEEGGYIPVNLEVYQDSVFLQARPELNYYRSLLASGVHRPYVEDYTRISDVISYFSHLAIKGDMPVDVALKEATAIINHKKAIIY